MTCLEGQEDHNLNQQGVLKVKRLFSYAVLFASVLTLSTLAQPVAAQSVNIAVIDVYKVLKTQTLFKKQAEAIRLEMEQLKQTKTAALVAMDGMFKELQTYRIGSLEYKNLEKKLAEFKSAAEVKGALQQKELLGKDARLQFEIYTRIKKEVQEFSLQHSISLVIQYSSAPVNPNIPRSVQMGIANPVVFQNRVDITADILTRLNGVSVVGPGGTVPVRRDLK
ncbi:MAG: hypothetical protein COA78_27340 [Blastopirellula sp.]|nr:MAG: hypothetical protein COA78_27340 [Blastopirellula sp.]